MHAAAARKQEIMCEPLDSLDTSVEESGEPIPPPMLPMMNRTTDGTPERRSLLDRLLKRSADFTDATVHFSPRGEVENRLKQEVQELRLRVKELEEDCKLMAVCKQKEVETLMAKCAAEEEGRRKAEEGMQRADEACRQADEERRRAEEGRRRAEANLDRENEECAEEKKRINKELKSLCTKVHQLQAQLDVSRRTSLERRGQHGGPRKSAWWNASPPLCNSDEVIASKATSLELSCVLQCVNGEAQRHLRTFYGAMDTSSQHVAYMSGNRQRDWRCLAEYVGLHEDELRATNCERRLSIIFAEWARREFVTVAHVHKVLTESQCTRAAECLLSAAQSVVEQEEGDIFLDLGGEAIVQSC